MPGSGAIRIAIRRNIPLAGRHLVRGVVLSSRVSRNPRGWSFGWQIRVSECEYGYECRCGGWGSQAMFGM